MDEKWGLETLTLEEELTGGGLTFKELWEMLNLLGDVVKKIEKYWPSFKEGFVAGWEGA